MRLLIIMASYQPPSEFLPIFDNTVFTDTNPTSTSGGGLTLAQANLLYLRKNFPDICTALETFNGGISTTFLNASGNIVASGNVTGTSIYGNPITSSIQSLAPTSVLNIATSQTSGILNICTSAAKTGNINIGTFATGGQLSLGSSSNTQTNLYGNVIYLANATQINGNLTMVSGSIIGYLTSALAAATYATIASLSSYLTIASASATYLTQISASTTYATIASLSSYLTTATAAATYLTLISASATYATIASLSNYLTTATAASTYATISSLGAYLTTATATSTFLTITNAASTYATISSLSSYLTTAAAASTYATITSLSSYLTTATAASTYATITSLSSYLTTATAASTYATISSLSSYLTTATAASTYAPINAPTFTTSIGLTSGNINASSGSITASGTVTGSTLALSGASGSITGTYGNVTQTLNNYTIKGTYNLNLDQTNVSGTVVIGSTNGKVTIGKFGGGGTLQLYGNTTLTNGSLTLTTGNINNVNDITTTGIFTSGGNIVLGTGAIINGVNNSIEIGTVNTNQLITVPSIEAYTGGTGGVATNLNIGIDISKTSVINMGIVSLTGALTILNNGITLVGAIGDTPIITPGAISGDSITTNSGTINGNLNVTGTLSAGSLTYSSIVINAITAVLSSSTVNLYNNLISGVLNIGCNTSRTSGINIGTGSTVASSDIVLGSTNTNTTVNGILTVNAAAKLIAQVVESSTAVSGVSLYDNNTTGLITIGSNASRTENIQIGTRLKILGTTFISTVLSDVINLFTTSTGNLNFGNTGTTTSMPGALTVTQNLTATGGLTLGSNQGITCGAVPPTLTTSKLGYFFNFPLRTNTGLTSSSAGYRYNPQTNVAGAGNFMKAGVYYATINVIYRYTSSPTAFGLNYDFGISSSTTAGTATTGTNTNILPVSRTNTGTLITGANNNDFCSSHSLCFTLTTDSYVNTFFNVDTISITAGTLNINQIGTIYRIA